MAKSRTLLIRADSGPVVGSGHVMRCLALAEAWAEAGGEIRFLAKTSSPQLDARLREVGALANPIGIVGSAEDAEFTSAEAVRVGAAWVVVDGYGFDAVFEGRVATSGAGVLTVDDLGGRPRYSSHALLNQNAYADESLYATASAPPIRLLGNRYALLRREFRERRGPSRAVPPRACRLLVSMGGGDAQGVSLTVLEALRLLKPEGLEVTLLVGSNNPRLAEVEAAVRHLALPVQTVVGARDVAERMAWADAAVQAGGSTVWESCCMGLPSLVVCLAENQRRIVDFVAATGVGESLGWHGSLSVPVVAARIGALLEDAGRRKAMSEAGAALIDGLGALRVVDALISNAR